MRELPEAPGGSGAPGDRYVPPRWLSEGAERLAHGGAPPRFDVVVVGSGYGGAVAAARFAALQGPEGTENAKRRKLTVAVLERGDEVVPGSFPDRFSQVLPHLRAQRRDDGEPPLFDAGRAGLDSALFDFHFGEQVSALVGNGLGGGSLINAGVVEAPEQAVFADARWPSAIQAEAASGAAAWNGYFDTASAMLSAKSWTGLAPKTDALFRGTEALRSCVEVDIQKTRPKIAVTQVTGANAQGVVQAACIACGNCVTGCNFWAKNTLPMNYLAEARRRGAHLFTGATVLAVRPATPAADGDWIISYRLTHDRRERDVADAVFEVVAGHVVLAAGTFGSTQILSQSALIEPALRHLTGGQNGRLGRGFSCNGDGIAAAYDQDPGKRPVDGVGADPSVRQGVPGTAGPTITGMLDLRRRARLADRFVIQDAAVPFALKRIYEELLLGFGMVHRMTTWNERGEAGVATGDPLASDAERLERTQFLLMVGHDDAGWRLEFQETASRAGAGTGAIPLVVASVAKRPATEMVCVRERQRAMNDVVTRLTAAAPGGGGGIYIPNPAWQPAPAELIEALRPDQTEDTDPDADPLAAERLVTVHPLGGCAMADTAEEGVVNHLGQVFRAARAGAAQGGVFANLVVMDGSTVPCSLGINPLLTICALAERSCEGLRAAWKLSPDPTPLEPLPPQPKQVAPLAWQPASSTALLFTETMDGPLSLVVNKNANLRSLSVDELAEALDARAELRIRASVPDVWGLVRDPHHLIAEAQGELTLFWKGSKSRLPPFDLMPIVDSSASPRQLKPILLPVQVRLLELLPSGRDERIWRALRHWRATRGLAFLRERIGNRVLRKIADLGLGAVLGIDSARVRGWVRELLEWVTETFGFGKQLLSMAKIASHHGEARAMTYELPSLQPADTPFEGPVRVLAAKRIHYGSSPGYRQRPSKTILNPHLPDSVPSNPWRAIVELQVLMVSETEGRSLAEADWPADQRPPWLDPRRHSVVATGTWTLDLEEMIGRGVPQLQGYRTLPDAWLDTASFAAFMGRTLLQSYFWSWRLPAYPPPLRFGGADLGPLPGFRLGSDGKTYVERPGRGDTWEQRAIGMQRVVDADGDIVPGPPATLVLTHYWPAKSASIRRRHPVVMLHGFVTSGYQFATPRLQTNAVDWLTAQGFDVWVVDLRTSVAVASSHEAWDFDTVARVDVPAAIDAVLAATGAAQVHVVAHCMGSAAFNMAVLAGELTRGGRSVVRSAVQTLVSMDVVSTPPNRLKAAGLRFVEDVLQVEELRVTADREVLKADRIIETLADRLLMTWPKNDVDAGLQADNELWKPRPDYIASVNRINALYGRNFSHANLSSDMLRHLHEVFRHANVRTFRHVLQFHRAGRVVDRKGTDSYVKDEAIREHYRFPVRFLHGQFGAVFRASSTRRSRIRLDRLLPQYVHERITLRSPRDSNGQPVRPNWGHFDIWLSEHSAAEVFPRVSEFLAAHDGPAPIVAEPPLQAQRYRYEPPDLGPRLGWWRADPATAADGIARIWFRSPFRDDSVRVAVFAAPVDAPPGTRLRALTAWESPSLQHRCGTIDVKVPALLAEQKGWGLAVVCRSPQATWFTEGDTSLRPPNTGSWWGIDPKGDIFVAPLGPVRAARARPAPVGTFLTGEVEGMIPEAFADKVESIGTVVSSQLIATPVSLVAWTDSANDIAAASAAVPPIVIRRGLFTQLKSRDRLSFFLASCRYQATEMESEQADRSLAPLLTGTDVGTLDFALLVGDQIYADASYGVLDSRPSTARLRSKYTSLWSGGAGALGRRLPVYLCGDDHELRDGWFGGVRTSDDQAANDKDGFEAMNAYQYAAMPGAGAPRHYGFEAAGFLFYVLDTRFERGAPGSAIWQDEQRDALTKFLNCAGHSAPERPVFIVSSVPVLPFDRGFGDLVDVTRGDLWQSYPASLAELFRAIVKSKCRHVVLLSGDRHLSQHARGTLRNGTGDVIAIESIVSSGLNAPIPFANKNPGDLVATYNCAAPGLPGHELRYEVVNTEIADGWARVEVAPTPGGWEISSTFQAGTRGSSPSRGAPPLAGDEGKARRDHLEADPRRDIADAEEAAPR